MQRRSLLFGLAPAVFAARKPVLRIREVQMEWEDHLYRTPYMFGGRKVDRVTLLNASVVAEDGRGRKATGKGSMSMGNQWAFPSRNLSYDDTLNAMRQLAARIAELLRNCSVVGHPLDLHHDLEPRYLQAAAAIPLAEPIPALCTLVVASPFDAAVHDAYGRLLNRSCFTTLGPEHLSQDMGHYLGPEFRGLYPQSAFRRAPAATVPLYHSVGASDNIIAAAGQQRVGDGLPETLAEWIRFNGLTHLKIKLNGGNLEADLDRIFQVDAVANEFHRAWKYCLDFNERCPNVDYLLECLRRIEEKTPSGFQRIQYIEQPTQRNLAADRTNVMHKAAKLRPVVIDESLVDLETLQLARDMGYTGVALKACKGQSHTALMAAAAQRYGMFRCVQDLTCPGASFVHSASIAAWVQGASGVEGNSRQYVPSANAAWTARFPGLFRITDGQLRTGSLRGPGLGT
jgi:L-alanine-DL-glutamate epimerase-like enolase superfamily enzyme